MTFNPIISFITVGMNHLVYVKNLYDSLYGDGQPSVSFEAIYVDNCSTDGSVEFIRCNYPKVKILINTVSKGFGENNNIGVLASTGKYIMIINPDIILQRGCIDELYYFSKRQVNDGILVPQLLNPNGTVQFSIREFVSIKILFYRILSKGNDNYKNTVIDNYLCKNLDFNKVQTVNWAIGAALFLSRDLYSQLGGFDLDYYLYMEDEDICLRAWKLNKTVIYVPSSKMVHNHLRGSSKLGKKTMLHFRSLFTFFRKHGLFVKCN